VHVHDLKAAGAAPSLDSAAAIGEDGGALDDGAPEAATVEAACQGLLWMDALLAQLMAVQEVRQRVLLHVVVTPQGAIRLPPGRQQQVYPPLP
jgi:hypothetical protein